MANGTRTHSRLWYLLLILPYAAMIWVPSYNSQRARMGRHPLFLLVSAVMDLDRLRR